MTTSNSEGQQIPHFEGMQEQGRASAESGLFEGRSYSASTQELWDDRVFRIKLDYLNTFSSLGIWAARAIGSSLILVALYMIVFFVVHYTIPRLEWVNDTELGRVEGFYARLAVVAVPFMLMTNAWVIWWMSRTRREAESKSSN